ncbi:hypothetical protein M501DRAFT_929436 [Patellaria atrata CBS 101060]|uniref:Ubiquitin-like 1-activating enzyme E1A n=1 Tax=Patellaria atrata CBS 101060 TaxID=1346257 RepID=A0A9P4SHH9_9PEZI|nr:hypothetical protein M501DRAFT_929436 [Patellaria atrata CBS 101060]
MNTNGSLTTEDPAGELVGAIAQAQTISPDEIALYDRQIRLWGVQAQEKIRTANILLISIRALANEVAKNLVLAGIGSLTIVDHELVTEDDLCSQFLVTDADINKNRAEAAAPQLRKLNPRVNITADSTAILAKDPSFFSKFDIIISTDPNYLSITMINAACRVFNRPFYAAGAHGFYGYIFSDLIDHTFVIERELSNRPTQLIAESATRRIIRTKTKKENGKNVEMVTKQELFSPLQLANTSSLPPEILKSRRKLRQVSPLLPCFRALWEFQSLTARSPSHSQTDLQMFTTSATEKTKELQLPPETLRADFLRSFLQNLDSELAPVTAFLGGELAQDIINVLGKREQPIQNLLLFDGEMSVGPVYPLHPIFEPLPADHDNPGVAVLSGIGPVVPIVEGTT